MKNQHTKTSKFLSYVLRHKPDAIGLELDAEGWARVQDIIDKADIALSAELIKQVVEASDKQRFALSDDGQYIRANQGHSLKVDLGLTPVQPPKYLYHGTAERFIENIKAEGLKPQSRQYVHLSSDTQTAQAVGKRHEKPVILKIPALEMHNSGHKFYQAKNGVWLTKQIAPHAILLFH